MELDETMETARQTIAQIDDLLRTAREQLRGDAHLESDNTISAASISAFVEDQDEQFRRAYAHEHSALDHLMQASNSTSLAPASSETRLGER
ncbi:hypothetical protein ACKWRH_45640 (plasmid) [Bradyrhizobium sp. Pa8]|uniref:hypothetical protein n=1 Tax=Bradyrhizobium sp. Pa8 TaxID=3386552 RepID=UPI00403F34BD